MKTFKITNITNLLDKRSFKQNSELEASYIDGMVKKTLKIKSGEIIYLRHQSLPLSIHRLRIKGLVTVTELSDKEMNAIVKSIGNNENVSDTPKKNRKNNRKSEKKPLVENKVENKTSKRTIKKNEQSEIDEIDEIKP